MTLAAVPGDQWAGPCCLFGDLLCQQRAPTRLCAKLRHPHLKLHSHHPHASQQIFVVVLLFFPLFLCCFHPPRCHLGTVNKSSNAGVSCVWCLTLVPRRRVTVKVEVWFLFFKSHRLIMHAPQHNQEVWSVTVPSIAIRRKEVHHRYK
jgi:hypothetical protein